jgi:protoporphyrin/coproporphyrin ferrochelatase
MQCAQEALSRPAAEIDGAETTAIVLLNLGGPAQVADVGPFLQRMFADRELIRLPLQGLLGPWIARRRTPKVQAKYQEIGGGSPILSWTERQAAGLLARLAQRRPGARHRAYIAFRYAEPLSARALTQMAQDGVTRAVAFSQYPQWSCSTTGASLNELWREQARLGLDNRFRWTLIDRWPTHPGFVRALAATVQAGLLQLPADVRNDALILFSAHSLPLEVIDRGDPYPQEVAATVQAVMTQLGFSHEFLLSYQSDIPPLRWLGPGTERVLHALGHRKCRAVLAVPVAFTSDHIETLHELDIEYAALARAAGITHFARAPALNDHPLFLDALADMVCEHLVHGARHSTQYRLRCPGCQNPACRQLPA